MEKSVSIPSRDNDYQIKGVLRGEFVQPLIVLAPGLGGWMHDLLLFNASRYFEGEGMSTLRVSFYGDDSTQRDIGGFGVKQNSSDIDSVVEFARNQGSKWICVIGHSYSGMAIVYSREQAFDAAILWDASHTNGYDEPESRQNLENDFLYINELDSYVSAKGPGYIISRKVFEDYQPGSTTMAQKFKIDTLVVNASQSGEAMFRFGKSYAKNIIASTQHVVIPGASHSFTENGAMEELFGVTSNWIKQKTTQT